MRGFVKLLLGLFLWATSVIVAQELGLPKDYMSIIALGVPVIYWLLIKPRKPSYSDKKEGIDTPNPNGAIYVLDGVNDTLEVFADKVTITPKRNAASILIRGMKGSKTIPFASITAIQFREANPINGYIQFSILGGIESGGGFMAAIGDENSCFFIEKSNKLACEIRDYIELRIAEIRVPKAISAVSIADEIQKLAKLYKQGIISEAELAAAKNKLIAHNH